MYNKQQEQSGQQTGNHKQQSQVSEKYNSQRQEQTQEQLGYAKIRPEDKSVQKFSPT